MTYKDLTSDEFDENITEVLADACIDIAHENSDFICEQCLYTLRRILSVLAVLDGKVCQETRQEVNEILERDDF